MKVDNTRNTLIDIDLHEKMNKIIGEYKYEGQLYHYTIGEKAEKILESGKIWLRDIRYMNDTKEGQSILELVRKVSKTMFEEGSISENLLNYISSYSEMETRTFFYVACFCKKNDNEHMWKEYADNSKGCCLVLNSHDTDPNIKFISVLYEPEEKIRIIKRLLAEIDRYKNYYPEFYYFYLDYICNTLRYCFKSNNYADENEVRII